MTPWGMSQSAEDIGGGIISYSTAGHGGLFVPTPLLAEMPDALRCNCYAGGNWWFEEDCEWALVALAYPQYFTAEQMGYAIDTIRAFKTGTYAKAFKWLETSEAGRALTAKYMASVSA